MPACQEDELPPERAQSSLEDYDEGAQASDATVDGNAVEQQAADAKPDVSAWRRFVDERMGAPVPASQCHEFCMCPSLTILRYSTAL